MNENNEPLHLADLADGVLTGAQWDAWLAAHPAERDELLTARRVHRLLAQLRDMPVTLPMDFEERLLDRLQHNATILDLLDHWLGGWGRTLVELLELLLSGLQTPSEATPPH